MKKVEKLQRFLKFARIFIFTFFRIRS